MSDSTLNTFGVDSPEPSDRMKEVVALVDSGQSNKEIADALGIAPGTVSNARTEGLRRMGRGDEVTTSTTQGPKAGAPIKPRGAAEILTAEIAKVDERLTVLVDKVNAARAAVDGFKGDDVVKGERERIADAIAALQAEDEVLDTAEGKKAFIAAARERVTAERDALVDKTTDEVDALTLARESLETSLVLIAPPVEAPTE